MAALEATAEIQRIIGKATPLPSNTPTPDESLCAGLPVGWWFPIQGVNTTIPRAVCAHCPAQAKCRTSAPINSDGLYAGQGHRKRRNNNAKVVTKIPKEHLLGDTWSVLGVLAGVSGPYMAEQARRVAGNTTLHIEVAVVAHKETSVVLSRKARPHSTVALYNLDDLGDPDRWLECWRKVHRSGIPPRALAGWAKDQRRARTLGKLPHQAFLMLDALPWWKWSNPADHAHEPMSSLAS